MSGAVERGQRLDPITLEVIRSGLVAVVREMSVTLARTAYSTIIRDVHDFSCVIFDGAGRLIAQAEGLPSFNGGMSYALEAVAAAHPLAEMRPGDVYITNDPYYGEGASFHKNDINIVTPVFLDGTLVALSASKAHYLDIGGKDPGSFSPDARNSFQEGLTLPPLKLYGEGVLNDAIVEILLANGRAPALARGDLAAQVAAGRTAEQRILALYARYGAPAIAAAVHAMLDHAERVVRAAIEAIPDGRYEAVGHHDGDGVNPGPIPIRATVEVTCSDITVDVTGSAAQRDVSAGNCHWLETVAVVREAVMFLCDTSLGTNAGAYRPIHVVAPRGCVYRPVAPAPTTTGCGDLGVRLIELILRALAPVLPEQVIAGTFGTVSALTLAGHDPGTDEEFIHFSPYAGGWGARAERDGNSAMVSILSGDNFNVPCEVMETRFPGLLAERYALRAGTGGAGRFRGGMGIAYDYRTLVDLEVSVALDHYAVPPYGLAGGRPGVGSALVIAPGEPGEQVVHQRSRIPVRRGTTVSHRTAGGGGYGDPFLRPADAVLEDVRDELLTPDDALRDYGVALSADGRSLDPEATARAREASTKPSRNERGARMFNPERGWDLVIRVSHVPIDYERAALLVIDLQNSFANREVGVFKRLADAGMAAEGEYAISRLESTVIPNVARLAAQFRAVGAPVIFARSASQRGDGSDQTARHRGQGLAIPEWSHEAQIVDELTPERGDIVLLKSGSGCFTSTSLDHLLRNMRAETLVLTGMWTNSCVETTARHAGDLDYRVVLAEDACVAFSPELHDWAIRYLADNFATVHSTDQLIASLSEVVA